MRILRTVALIATLYVGIDLLDPSVPGVFFFESENLFIDGLARAKASVPGRVLAVHIAALWVTVDSVRRIMDHVPDPEPGQRRAHYRPPPNDGRAHVATSDAVLDEDAHA